MRPKNNFEIETPTWCPGCGLYGIFDALKRSASALTLDPENLVIVTGIGCHGRLNNYFKSYGFHGLHGRVLPVAQGVKLANPRLQVLGVSGDGDAYSIGLGHFLHALRRNISLVYLVVDNRIYGLTEGQTSPTSEQGFVSVSTPSGSKEQPLDGPALAFAAGGTFVARGFSGEVGHLADLLQNAFRHKGLALVDVLSPCVTHNKINTYEWFRKKTYLLDEDRSFDPRDRVQACAKLNEKERIPLGLIYLEEMPPFESLVLPSDRPPIALDPLEPRTAELEKIMEKFR
jgi:2-oxoglutarate ferredoxin oxidoreductase subunit beta